jgi:hypothetical protein
VSLRPIQAARQSGQSLVEFAVLSAVLVPLFLLIPIMGKYIHVRQASQQVARAAAWEATVSPGYALPQTTRVRDLAVERNFGAIDDPIRSRVQGGATNAQVGNPLLNTFSGRALLERGDVRVNAYRNVSAPGIQDKLTDMMRLLPGYSPPNSRGLVTSNIEISTQDIRLANGSAATFLEPFDRLDLRMQASHTLLADAWNASGPGSGSRPGPRTVLAQTRPLVPMDKLDPLDSALNALDWLPLFGALEKLDIGYIDPDVVPYDKMERYAPR